MDANSNATRSPNLVASLPDSRGTKQQCRLLHYKPIGDAAMPDDKSKVVEPDRSKMVADHYEVNPLAQKYGLTQREARDLIARVGNDRDKLDRAAKELSGRW